MFLTFLHPAPDAFVAGEASSIKVAHSGKRGREGENVLEVFILINSLVIALLRIIRRFAMNSN